MNATADTAVTEVAKSTTKAKVKEHHNLILEVAQEVESLSKTKALNMASNLADDIETNYFKLGGVLKVIFQNSWFEGYEKFDTFVYEKFGFHGRKAEYLMKLYTDLVDKQIPWEKVKDLGWTKLKDLSAILTLENVDEWVAKAMAVSVIELQAMLKATMPAGEASGSTDTTSNVEVMKFKLVGDQVATVKSALAAVKGQIGTDHDNVALENLCAAFLAGVSGPIAKPLDIQFQEMGYEQVLAIFDKVFPNIDIDVKVPQA
jgi:hypothetical protein